MTAAQKIAKEKFKKAIAYRQKTGVSLKEAFAYIYGRKVSAVKKLGKKKIGALPIGFKGSIYDIGFKIVNQYDIYNDVSAIMEDTTNGNRIVTFDGKGSPKDKAEAIVSYISKNTNIQGGYRDDKQLYSRMLKFSTGMQKEVKDFNSGKKKTIKKEPFKIAIPKNTKMPIKKKVAKKVIKKSVRKHTHYKKIKSHQRRVNGIKRKPTEKAVLKSIQKAVKTQKSHMSGFHKIIGSVASKYYIDYITEDGYKKMEFFSKFPKGYYKGMDRIIYVTRLAKGGTNLIPVKYTDNNKEVKK